MSLLQQRKTLWESIFYSENDQNSIVKQLLQLLWSTAVFRIINETRAIAERDNRHLNGMLHQAINHDFWANQLTAIRRLTDPESIDGPRGVCSLPALIKDMEAHRHLMTREAFFEMDGLDYDLKVVQKKYEEFRKSQKLDAYWVPQELYRPQNLHEMFDRLSGVDPDKRSRQDTISPKLFTSLQTRLTEAWPGEFNIYINKYVAHAATQESRGVAGNGATLTLGALYKAHEILCRTANFIGDIFLKGGGISLPYPQFNHLENIDQPLIPTSQVGELDAVWTKYEREVSGFQAWDITEVIGKTP